MKRMISLFTLAFLMIALAYAGPPEGENDPVNKTLTELGLDEVDKSIEVLTFIVTPNSVAQNEFAAVVHSTEETLQSTIICRKRETYFEDPYFDNDKLFYRTGVGLTDKLYYLPNCKNRKLSNTLFFGVSSGGLSGLCNLTQNTFYKNLLSNGNGSGGLSH